MRSSTHWIVRSVFCLAACALLAGTTCQYIFPPCCGDATVTIKLINDSSSQYVSASLGVCPNGMAAQPHHFVDPAPVLAPGQELTYTTCQIGGVDGNCQTYTTDFMIGLCGWQYGASATDLTAVYTRYGGQIGVQFHCGDTVTLRWSDTGGTGGAWTSSVEVMDGNVQPTADFQEL